MRNVRILIEGSMLVSSRFSFFSHPAQMICAKHFGCLPAPFFFSLSIGLCML